MGSQMPPGNLGLLNFSLPQENACLRPALSCAGSGIPMEMPGTEALAWPWSALGLTRREELMDSMKIIVLQITVSAENHL